MLITKSKCVPVLLLAFILVVGCVFPGLSCAKDAITWMEAVAPPFFIHDGTLKGQGYEDLVTDILEHQLPQYDHEMVLANIARHYSNFQHGEKVCTVGFFKTPEREEFAYYSIPSFFTLPTVLIIKKEHFAKFGGKKIITLNDMFINENITIGIAKDRSYGKYIDEIIEPYKEQNNVVELAKQDLAQTFFKMLLADRIDALLGFPEEAMYIAEQAGARDKIMTLTIAENQKGYDGWLSYVACSKNDWGKKAIENINHVLLQERPTDQYRGAYERWLDESSLEDYRKLYKDVFLTVTQ